MLQELTIVCRSPRRQLYQDIASFEFVLKIQLLLASALHDSQHLMYAKKFVVNLRNKLQIADNKSVCGVSGGWRRMSMTAA